MFRVSFFVEDKHLAPVMHGLSGVARDLQVVPVVNAAPAANGKVKQKAGSSRELVLHELAKLKRGVTSGDIKATCKKLGLSALSWNHFANDLVKAGALSRAKNGKGSIYTVVQS